MKTIFKLVVLCLAILTSNIAIAQKPINDWRFLEESIQRRGAEKVKQMNDHISFIANKKKAYNDRTYHKTKCLNLFIGKGNEYQQWYGSQYITRKGVFMEVTSLSDTSLRRHPLMKTYLTSLFNLRYSEVVIQTTALSKMRVSNLQHVYSNEYTCTVYFQQAFAGFRDGRPVYIDITEKAVKCYVEIIDGEDGKECIVRLGDVHATQTRGGTLSEFNLYEEDADYNPTLDDWHARQPRY